VGMRNMSIIRSYSNIYNRAEKTGGAVSGFMGKQR
jgi:hypothetical protein